MRNIREEDNRKAEAQRAAALQAGARQTLRRIDRINAAKDRLQGFLTMLHDHLRDQRNEAARHGEHVRVARIEHQIDELFHEFDEIAELFGDRR